MEAILTRPTKTRSWSGLVVTAIPTVFLTFDGVAKLFKPQPVIEALERLGYPVDTAAPIGALLLACVAVYVVRRSAPLGAVLLTGYLGGAVSTHVRAGSTLFETIFPILVGALVWAGAYLRDARVRALAPWA